MSDQSLRLLATREGKNGDLSHVITATLEGPSIPVRLSIFFSGANRPSEAFQPARIKLHVLNGLSSEIFTTIYSGLNHRTLSRLLQTFPQLLVLLMMSYST